MKKSELRQIIREEISKLVSTNEITSNTSKLWDKWWGPDESAKEIQRKIRKLDDTALLHIIYDPSIEPDGGEYLPKPSRIKNPVDLWIALAHKEMERRGVKVPSHNYSPYWS